MHKTKKRDSGSALTIAFSELRKVRRGKRIEIFFFSLLVLSTTFLLVFLMSGFFLTGFASISSQAGYITEVTLTAVRSTYHWHGLHGLALRVPGYISQISSDLTAGEISSVGLFLIVFKVTQ